MAVTVAITPSPTGAQAGRDTEKRGGQVGSLKLPMRVRQLNPPSKGRYAFVYQKVQSSAGSTASAL